VGGALVTGGGRGLGLAIAGALAARGLQVHITDIDGEAAEHAAASLGTPAFGSPLDVRDAEACGAAAQATLERAGSLEVWVNNAGILAPGVAWEHSTEVRKATLEVNALGTINGTVAALEPMRKAGRGHVINVISLAGLVAAPGEVLYSASKHAAMAFTLGTLSDLRRAGIRGIHVSAVCPDGIWTPMLTDKLDDPDAAASFSGKLLGPTEVAERTAALLDRPRPVLVIPRYRGLVARVFDMWPSLAMRLVGVVMADARRRQRAWKRRIAAGNVPR
jgi:NAD(P)-dependent dehydrogenase (short-subunit alcohol dehydrogenase family)